MFQKILAAILSLFSFSFLKTPVAQITSTPVPPTPTYALVSGMSVHLPKTDDQIDYILTIAGQAKVFENQFQWRLKDANNKVLTSGTAMSDAPDAGQMGNFRITTSYPIPSTPTGWVDVYDSSPKDGRETNLVATKIKFPVGPVSSFNLYFGQYSPDSTMTSCEKVFPVKRYVAKTPAIAQAAINSLLSGLTTEESKRFYTSINPGVTLNKITLENGIATVDFSDALQKNVGGSCRVANIRAQITQTLKQFPTVKSVIISVNGDSESSLQP